MVRTFRAKSMRCYRRLIIWPMWLAVRSRRRQMGAGRAMRGVEISLFERFEGGGYSKYPFRSITTFVGLAALLETMMTPSPTQGSAKTALLARTWPGEKLMTL